MLQSQKLLLSELEKVTKIIERFDSKSVDLNYAPDACDLIYMLYVREHLRRCVKDYNNEVYSEYIEELNKIYEIKKHDYVEIDKLTYKFAYENYIRLTEYIENLKLNGKFDLNAQDIHGKELADTLGVNDAQIYKSNLICIDEFKDYIEEGKGSKIIHDIYAYVVFAIFALYSLVSPFIFKSYVAKRLDETSYNNDIKLVFIFILGFAAALFILVIITNNYNIYSGLKAYITRLKSGLISFSNISIDFINGETDYIHITQLNRECPEEINLDSYTRFVLNDVIGYRYWVVSDSVEYSQDNNTQTDNIVCNAYKKYGLDLKDMIITDSDKENWNKLLEFTQLICDFKQLQDTEYIYKLRITKIISKNFLMAEEQIKDMFNMLLTSGNSEVKDGKTKTESYVQQINGTQNKIKVIVDVIDVE